MGGLIGLPDIMIASATLWLPLRGLRFRSTENSPSCLAKRGISSVNWIPGRAVSMAENSPRMSALAAGFGSMESMWLVPP